MKITQKNSRYITSIFLTACLVSIHVVSSIAQQAGTTSYSLNSMLTDLKGEPLTAGNDVSIEGSPFYNTEWVTGMVTLNNQKRFDGVQLKVNLHSDNIHYFIPEIRSERVAASGMVSEVEFNEPVTNARVRFRCGFPVIGNNDLKTFYQVLASGKATVLKQIKKTLIEEKAFNSATITRRFDTEKNYYVFSGNAMTKLKRTKSDIVALLGDQKSKIEEFIAANKLNTKSDEDLVRIFDYYNSL